MNYPSPCEKCHRDGKCGGCKDWEIRYRYRQKQINAYAQRGCAVKVRRVPESKFCYNHPDDVKRWLRTSPCASCTADAICDIPCPAYLRWCDARMQIARRKAYG